MRKLLLLFLAVVFLFAGCSTKTTGPRTSTYIWSDAINHIGENAIVYGKVIDVTYSSSSRGKPTFIDIGKAYPDPARFTALIWDNDLSKFTPLPEDQYYKGETIYVEGNIQSYQDGAEIVVSDPEQITTR